MSSADSSAAWQPAQQAPRRQGEVLAARSATSLQADAQLAAFALALGAADCGGPLTADEQLLVAMAESMPGPSPSATHAMQRAIQAGDDALGYWFCQIRPAPLRRRDGAFYTPPALVAPLVRWVLAADPQVLIDPGCGSGRFVAAAIRARPNLRVIAIDRDPLATLCTRAVLRVLGAHDAAVHQEDYLRMTLPPTIGKRAFLANPPYVRHHDLTSEDKAWAVAAARQLDLPISGLAGLHTLFYLATALAMRPGDVGCFITSAEWLDTRYGQTLRRLLTATCPAQILAVIDPQATPFDDAMATAVVTCFTRGEKQVMASLKRCASPTDLDLGAPGQEITHTTLASTNRWSPFFRAVPESLRLRPASAERTVRLGDLFRVHRGIATGANAFFVLRREEATAQGIAAWCRPAITRATEILQASGMVRDVPERRLLLAVPPDVDRSTNLELDHYLRRGEASRNGSPPVAAGYLASHRTPWWYLGPPAPAPIVVSYMARQAPAFAANPDGLLLLNIAHGLYPRRSIAPEQAARVAAYLNAVRTAFVGQGRIYQGGLEKFEPRELEDSQIPYDACLDACLRSFLARAHPLAWV